MFHVTHARRHAYPHPPPPKRFIAGLLVLVSILLGTSAFAQSFSVGANASVGFFPFSADSPDLGEVPTTPTALGGQVTVGDIIGNLGLRALVEAGIGSERYFEIGGDTILVIDIGNIRPYLGVGASTRLQEENTFQARGVLGLEFLITNDLGLFAELDPVLRFDDFPDFETKLRAGANLHF